MSWSLVVEEEDGLRQLLEGAARETLQNTPCYSASNIREALTLLETHGFGNCCLIICSLTARLNEDHVPAVARNNLVGLQFVHELHEKPACAKLPAILVASFVDMERASAIDAEAHARVWCVKDFSQLRNHICDSSKQCSIGSACRLDVDIELRLGHYGWRMTGSNGLVLEEGGTIDLMPDDIHKLRVLSKGAQYGDMEFFQILGLEIYKVIMADPLRNESLESKMCSKVACHGGLDAVRIRFNVDDFSHPILLETMAKPERLSTPPVFWMLRIPMFRKFGARGTRHPLFKDPLTRDAPVDCLIIEGNVESFDAGGNVQKHFDALPGAAQEIEWLHGYLEDNRRILGIGNITLLRYAEYAPEEFADKVRQALQSTKPSLVHYAGHSIVDQRGQARLVMGGEETNMMDIELFSAWAGSVKFMLLSSCESANSQFIMKLVEMQVPAVGGYAWPVKDDVALNFTQEFYAALLNSGPEQRHLEYAFMRAKCALHRTDPKGADWVSPILFLQTFEQP